MDYFLADDLSGALDAAAAFHHAGRRVRIALQPDAADGAASGDVIGITTETRNAAPAEAERIVRDVVAARRARGDRLVYKKIDSTLRGPVAAELAGLARALSGTQLLFCPANPAVGRTVRDGRLLVRGVPVAETEFARDPVSPVTESVIARLLGASCGPHVTVCDAETEADLAAAVAAQERAGRPWVGIGSGALARPVARAGAGLTAGGTGAPLPALPAGPILMIGGSAHAANREQAAVLARERGLSMHVMDLTNPDRTIAACAAELVARGGAILQLPVERTDSARALHGLTAVAQAVVERANVARIFATGGETAYALGRALGIAALVFERELEPGLSLSRGETARGPRCLAIKPGGFGDAQTWVRAWTALAAAR